MAKKPMPKTVKELVADLDKWPESWMGNEKDLEYGKKMISLMEKFIHYLMTQGLSRKTLREYVDGVWLLGGAIIKEVSIYNEYKKNPAKKLMEAIESGGCLPEGHGEMSKPELESFTGMCRKFEEFLGNPRLLPRSKRKGKSDHEREKNR
jgi:hypothetical protein